MDQRPHHPTENHKEPCNKHLNQEQQLSEWVSRSTVNQP